MKEYKTSLKRREASARYRARQKDDPEFRKFQSEYAKKWRQEHLEERRQKDSEYQKKNALEIRLKRKSLDVETHKQYILDHNGLCDICGGLPDGRWQTLTIDHCHKNNIFRGMLCSKCNRGIGFFQDTPELLYKAAEYLKKFEDKPMNDKIIATCNISGVIKELCSVVQKQFDLKDDDLIVHTGHTDQLELTCVLDKELWLQIVSYCDGFLEAVDIHDYMCTEYLNDR